MEIVRTHVVKEITREFGKFAERFLKVLETDEERFFVETGRNGHLEEISKLKFAEHISNKNKIVKDGKIIPEDDI